MKKIMLAVSLCVPFLAHATLGEKLTNPTVAQISGKSAVAHVAQNTTYSVQTATQNDITIKQYVARDGTVFAVSWSGPVKPNLSDLLGSYFTNLQTAHTSAGRNHAQYTSDQVVINSGGALRHFSGNAYIPSLVPQGFTFQ